MLVRRSSIRLVTGLTALIGFAAAAQQAPIVQPGAPGQATKPLTAEQAVQIADTRFSADDVRFMQDMIVHHQQAVEMAALVKGRTNRQPLIDAARRIDASQDDEIAFMRKWLRDRGQEASVPANAMPAMHVMPAMTPMSAMHGDMASMGMATPDQMAALKASNGPAFDRQFLELMITHHQGAVTMAEALLKRSGSAYDPILFEFVNDVINEQKAEIKRMTALLVGLVDDPRSTLKPGFRDAGQAISNLTLLASLPKPTGFFDPANPAGLPLSVLEAQKKADAKKPGKKAADKKDEENERFPLLSFANTDMAFSGDLLAVGNYHGFNLYKLAAGGKPELLSSVICPGGQGDLSIVGNLLIMSVEQMRGRVDCGRQGVSQDVSPDRFRGIRIFDISDRLRPVQVGQVQTCRGSHTHSVVSGPGSDGSIIVYVSGTATVRKSEELAGCIGEGAGDARTALFRIDVVEIPVAHPERARIIDSPAVFADPKTGSLAGLWAGGAHGDGTQDTNRTDQCHDITVFPSRNLAAGACSGNGIIFDIADPRKPHRIDAVTDPGFSYWHSATFNNDGTKVLFTDEWGGGGRPRCRVQDPRTWGADAFYDIVDNKLQYRGHYKLPAVQSEQENCVAHNGSIIPVPGRDIFVQAWYQGGLSVIDFTDSANPVEIAYFDRGPVNGDELVGAGYWSTYWYGGRIYGTEIARGLDVFALAPSPQMTENEIAAASLADYGGRFNPQQQFPVRWPDHPVVALAYLDQLQRGGAVTPPAVAGLRQALTDARAPIEGGKTDPALAARLASLGAAVNASPATPAAARQAAALKQVLAAIEAKLR
jgi:uncharacterized protein (DUF305 family)